MLITPSQSAVASLQRRTPSEAHVRNQVVKRPMLKSAADQRHAVADFKISVAPQQDGSDPLVTALMECIHIRDLHALRVNIVTSARR